MLKFKLHQRWYRELIFVVGVVATIAYRIIIFLNYLPSHFWSDMAWYLGTLGFVWYFAHRYNIEKQRDLIIKERQLVAKVADLKNLDKADREALVYTLNSLKSSKARWNYVVIFVASGLALIVDIAIRLNIF